MRPFKDQQAAIDWINRQRRFDMKKTETIIHKAREAGKPLTVCGVRRPKETADHLYLVTCKKCFDRYCGQRILKRRWVAYRTRHSYGRGDWEYVEIPAERKDRHGMMVKDWLHEYHVDFNCDCEHYRGAEYRFVYRPPVGWFRRELSSLIAVVRQKEQLVNHWRCQLDRLEWLIKLGKIKDVDPNRTIRLRQDRRHKRAMEG